MCVYLKLHIEKVYHVSETINLEKQTPRHSSKSTRF